MKRFILRFSIFLVVVALGAATGVILALVRGVPEIDEIKAYMPSHGTKVYADDDTLIGEFNIEKGEHVPITRIPENFIRAASASVTSEIDLPKYDFAAISIP